MFTGIVEELGTVRSIQRGAKSIRLTVAAQVVTADVKLGDSIAVNGVCLTVVQYARHWFTADVMPETMDKTVVSGLKSGDTVNLERALRVGDRLGGHIVSGHVDGVGMIKTQTADDNAVIVKISAAPGVMRYVTNKGSIAVDGISLTVVDTGIDWFTVSLIPQTAAVTTLGLKQVNDPVNLEVDVIGKYVEKMLGVVEQNPSQCRQPTVKLTRTFLAENGFDS